MIDQAKFNRMIDADNPDELLRILGETEFGHGRELGAAAYEGIIDAELIRVHELVASISPDPVLTGVFRAKHDFHNMKVLLKAGLASRDRGIKANADTAVSELGWLNMDDLRAAAMAMLEDGGEATDDPGNAVEHAEQVQVRAASESVNPAEAGVLAQAVVHAGRLSVEAYEAKGRDPQQIDFVLDRGSYEYFFNIARQRRATALLELLKQMVDLTNMLTCLRLRVIGKDASFAADALLSGGSISVDSLLGAYEGADEAFWAIYANTSYAQAVEEGIRAWRSTGSTWLLENIITRMLVERTAQVRAADISYEPVLGYLMARESEADRLRRIFLGKMAKLPAKSIRERLCGAYA